jgi:hypothetical protein
MAKVFGASASEKSARELQLADEEKQFENSLADEDCPDPLGVWVRYKNWIIKSYPSGTDKWTKLLQRCTSDQALKERYIADKRYVTLWIELADQVADPEEHFKFMAKNKIGQKHAVFYNAWANISERNQNFKKADKIYQKGIDMLAEPVQTIKTYQAQFARRMSRKWLEEQEGGAEEEQAAGTRRKSKKAVGSSENGGGNAGAGQRGALGALSKKATASGMSRAQKARPSRHSQQAPVGTGVAPPAAPAAQSNVALGIFNDFGAAAGPAVSAHDPFAAGRANDDVVWNDLGTQEARHRENTKVASSWDGQTLAGGKGAVSVPAAPAFAMFQDEEFEQQAAAEQAQCEKDQRAEASEAAARRIAPSFRILGDAAPPKAASAAAVETEQAAPTAAPTAAPKPKTFAANTVGYDHALLLGEQGEETTFEEQRALQWVQKAAARKAQQAQEQAQQQATLAAAAAAADAADATIDVRAFMRAAPTAGAAAAPPAFGIFSDCGATVDGPAAGRALAAADAADATIDTRSLQGAFGALAVAGAAGGAAAGAMGDDVTIDVRKAMRGIGKSAPAAAPAAAAAPPVFGIFSDSPAAATACAAPGSPTAEKKPVQAPAAGAGGSDDAGDGDTADFTDIAGLLSELASPVAKAAARASAAKAKESNAGAGGAAGTPCAAGGGSPPQKKTSPPLHPSATRQSLIDRLDPNEAAFAAAERRSPTRSPARSPGCGGGGGGGSMENEENPAQLERKENSTPPRGQSGRGRRSRSLATQGVAESVLAAIPVPALSEKQAMLMGQHERAAGSEGEDEEDEEGQGGGYGGGGFGMAGGMAGAAGGADQEEEAIPSPRRLHRSPQKMRPGQTMCEAAEAEAAEVQRLAREVDAALDFHIYEDEPEDAPMAQAAPPAEHRSAASSASSSAAAPEAAKRKSVFSIESDIYADLDDESPAGFGFGSGGAEAAAAESAAAEAAEAAGRAGAADNGRQQRGGAAGGAAGGALSRGLADGLADFDDEGMFGTSMFGAESEFGSGAGGGGMGAGAGMEVAVQREIGFGSAREEEADALTYSTSPTAMAAGMAAPVERGGSRRATCSPGKLADLLFDLENE